MKNVQIQGLRGVSILLIMIFHFVVRYQQIYVESYSDTSFLKYFANIGVFIFFIISGLYLERGESGFALIKKRFLSLWPKYFLSITLIYLLTQIVELPGRMVTLPQYLLNILFLNGFIGTPYVDGAHWFLVTLIKSLVFYSIILKFAPLKRDLLYLFFVFVILTFTIANKLTCDSEMVWIGKANAIVSALLSLFDWRIALVILGTMLSKRRWQIPHILTILLIFLLPYCTYGISGIWELLISMAFVFGAFTKKFKFMEAKLFVFLGELSYTIYLLHQNLGYIVLRSLGNYQIWMAIVPMVGAVFLALMFNWGFRGLNRAFQKFKHILVSS